MASVVEVAGSSANAEMPAVAAANSVDDSGVVASILRHHMSSFASAAEGDGVVAVDENGVAAVAAVRSTDWRYASSCQWRETCSDGHSYPWCAFRCCFVAVYSAGTHMRVHDRHRLRFRPLRRDGVSVP